MIGSGPIRSYVMGMDRCQGKEEASDSEIEEMARITKEAIEAGALDLAHLEHIYTEINLGNMYLELK